MAVETWPRALRVLGALGGATVKLAVPAGAAAVVEHPNPSSFVRAIATQPMVDDALLLGDVRLGAAAGHERAAAGLATAWGWGVRGYVDLTVVELLAAAAHLAGHDEPAAERKAAAAVLGRTGLARWRDADIGLLPPEVAERVDLVRALAQAPRALVWTAERQPGALRDLVSAHRGADGPTVVEVRPAPPRRA
ncbi:MAG: hypothetical protein KY434_11215 [Actinobacteria bacterium]|nr:hypothetical protein [Actinomycetota bacterium]